MTAQKINDRGWIVGYGYGGGGMYKSFVLRACAADFNGDNQIDFFDYLDFAAAFNAGDLSADMNNDGQVDFFDYLDFAGAYDTGC